ncbi:MAG: DUF2530 domain-containing protein [Micromonosporaceae bacterium]
MSEPPIKPLDPPMVPIGLIGTLLWGVIGLALLPFRDELAARGHAAWPRVCLAGFLIGAFGTGLMLVRERHRRRAAARLSSSDR